MSRNKHKELDVSNGNPFDFTTYDNNNTTAMADSGREVVVASPNGTEMTRDQLSILSGRMVVPGIPPKDSKEAHRHVQLIRRHQHHERRLVEREVKERRKLREETAQREKEWASIIPEFAQREDASKTRKLWAKGVPPSVRGQVWKLALGNPNDVSPLMFKMCVAKSRAAENAADRYSATLAAAAAAAAVGSTSSAGIRVSCDGHRSSSPAATMQRPKPTVLTSFDNLYDNSDMSTPTRKRTISSRAEVVPTAMQAGASSSPQPPRDDTDLPEGDLMRDSFALDDQEARRILDQLAFSPPPSAGGGAAGKGSVVASSSWVKEDSAKAIAVDLHRTIILRLHPATDPLGRQASPSQSQDLPLSVTACGPRSPMAGGGGSITGSQGFESDASDPRLSCRTPGGDSTGGSPGPGQRAATTSSFEEGDEMPPDTNHVLPLGLDGSSADAYYSYGGHHSPTHPSSLTMIASQVHARNLCDDAILLQKIRRLLTAFVELRPDIGYVQGMSYLAGMILLNIPNEHDAFIAFISLLGRGHFRYFYAVHHQGMSNYIATFEDVLSVGIPALYRHFTVIGVNSQLFVIDWWMSLFSRTLPYEIASRCWDLFLLDEAYLYRISLCLLLYFNSTILHEDSPMDDVLTFFSRIQHYSIHEHRFFEIVADEGKYPPSIDNIRKIMKKRAGDLPPL